MKNIFRSFLHKKSLVDSKYKAYASELGETFLEEAKEVISEEKEMIKKLEEQKKSRNDSTEYQFLAGKSFAYYRIISIMQQNAEALDIPLENIKLQNINPDKDLVP